jgi:adenine-specific DNA-methyltransferase
MVERVNIASKFGLDERAVVFQGDCREFLQRIPPQTIQLIVTSPPYNLGKEYEKRLHLADYTAQQREVIRDCVRALKPNGSICWQVGNYVQDGAIIPLDSLLYPVFAELGLRMRNRIVWYFVYGPHWQN